MMPKWLWYALLAYARYKRGVRDGSEAYHCPRWDTDEHNRNFALYRVHAK
jgi:hypothetical protein